MNCGIEKKWYRLLFTIGILMVFLPTAVLGYEEIPAGAVGGQTWGLGATYYVVGDITVAKDTTLSVQPGTVVKFAPGAQLTVNGTLSAPGTLGNIVVFTSRDDDTQGEIITGSDAVPAVGDWDGIRLYGYIGNQGVGEFDYCLVRYGGNSDGSADANIYYHMSDSGHFRNSVSELSSTDGLRTYFSSPEITNSTFTNNNGHAVYMDHSNLTPNATGNSCSGNGTDGMVLDGGVSVSQTWSPAGSDFPFVVWTNMSVNNGVTLAVEAGTVFKFVDGIQLSVNGTLDVNGTAADRVVFTSLKDDSYGGDTDGVVAVPAAGDWDGIYLNGYLGSLGIGEFDYCLVRYGGNSAGSADANIYYYRSDSGRFRNSVSELSSVDGLRILGSSPEITSSTFTNNSGHAVYMDHSNLTPNATGNSCSGNGTDGMVLDGGVSVSQTWSPAGSDFPFVVWTNMSVNNGVTLAVEAGTVFKFVDGIQLSVNGTLDVNGTAADRVVFTSLKDDSYGGDTDGVVAVPAAGDWDGIYLNGYLGSLGIGEFDYCLVRYGGNSAGSADANIYYYRSDSGHFRNSVSELSSVDGLRILGSSPEITSSTFTNNSGHAVYMDHSNLTPNATGNSCSGNGTDGMVLDGGVSVSQTWSPAGSDFPFVVWTNMSVNNGVTLAVEAGTVFKFVDGIQLSVNGTLDVNGTAADRVVFTSLKDDSYGGDTDGVADAPAAGDWDGIYFNGYLSSQGVGEFDYCLVRYGGNSAGAADANIYYRWSDSGHFQNSVSELSSTDGLRTYYSSPEIKSSEINDNLANGIRQTSSSVFDIFNNVIYGNDLDGILLSAAANIVNNTIVGNGGNGVGNIGSAEALLVNNIVADNIGFGLQCTGSPQIFTNNVWNNTAGDYSGCSPGSGDISDDPIFVDPVDSDFHLDYGSSSIDAGMNCITLSFVDKDGWSRFADGDFNGSVIIDMGAYEFGNYAGCHGDFNADGDVDGHDLAFYSLEIGRTDCSLESPCLGDFDDDGISCDCDVVIFAANFGRTNCQLPE